MTVVGVLATLVTVALRKESVDRNLNGRFGAVQHSVALRKESVDRNFDTVQIVIVVVKSLSARRAWIEIIDYVIDYVNDAVALRKESVDRNTLFLLSPPAVGVALRKESVDRNRLLA